MVTQAVGSAFTMASDELDAINKAINNQDLGQNGDKIRNVIKWMFMPDGQEPSAQRLGILSRNLGNLITARARNDNAADDGSNVRLLAYPWSAISKCCCQMDWLTEEQIVVYCNLDRFQKRDDGTWYDPGRSSSPRIPHHTYLI